MPQQPIVCFVTPTNANAKSLKAFHDGLIDLVEGQANVDYQVFAAAGDNSKLGQLAKDAKKYVEDHVGNPPVPAVIVAGGTMAATKLMALTPTIPIVQAAGSNKLVQGNVTGFYLDALTICKAQYDALKAQNTPVAVLYDSKNDPSPDIYQKLVTYAGAQNINGVDIIGDLNNLNSDALKGPANKLSKGFLLIPNALFYDNCKKIAKAVEDADLQAAFYPEREYKKAHSKQKRNGKKVRGHNIPLTFARAAYYVDSLLDDPSCIGSLKFLEAVTDED
jgi:hypothetical protein